MVFQPPSYRSAASVSRSKTTAADADAMLEAALSGNRASLSSSRSPASLLRSATSPSDVNVRADTLLEASLSGNSVSVASPASLTSSISAAPPSYHQTSASAINASQGVPTLSASPHSLSIWSDPPLSSTARGSRSVSELNTAADKATCDLLRLRAQPTVTPVMKGALTSHIDRKNSNGNDSNSLYRITAAESKERLCQLQNEVKKANAQQPSRNTREAFREACSTDLLFLIDTTYSMRPYINAARDQIKIIVREVKETFLNETEVRIAVVSYTDHNQGDNSIRWLDFVTDPERVSEFLDNLRAESGADYPEDVLGGIQQALSASWKLQTRCVIHIADAPPHGSILHDYRESYDNYHTHGSEPHGLTYMPLVRQMTRLRLNYALLRITDEMDRMLLRFSEIYAAAGADVNVLKVNKYYHQINQSKGNCDRSAGKASTSKKCAKLLFVELPLGTSVAKMKQLVVRTVTKSASLSGTRVLNTVNRRSETSDSVVSSEKIMIPVIATRQDELDPTDVVTEEILSQWTNPTWFKETLTLEGICPDMGTHGASTLNEMMEADDNIKLGVIQLKVHKRPKPFAAGSVRVAYYARTAASANKFVMKRFKTEEINAMAQMIEDMRVQALCKAFALEFNSLLKEEYAIDFVVTTSWRDKSKKASANNSFLSLEPYIEGEYVKYNSNGGYVKEADPDDPNDAFNDAAQAFSHFTFERSFGYFMVTDLQGVGHSFTDPAIQTKDSERFKLSPTNAGEAGFKFFFASHECNSVCRKLELQSNKTMFGDKNWKFRETWPTMDNTVFCSNKLCRKIVRLTNAQKSPKFPGYHWCTVCWPQLQSTTVKAHCEESGPDHVFELSRFFYESQGQATPNKCPQHLEKDTTGFTAAAAGASLFTRMNSVSQRTSNSGRAW